MFAREICHYVRSEFIILLRRERQYRKINPLVVQVRFLIIQNFSFFVPHPRRYTPISLLLFFSSSVFLHEISCTRRVSVIHIPYLFTLQSCSLFQKFLSRSNARIVNRPSMILILDFATQKRKSEIELIYFIIVSSINLERFFLSYFTKEQSNQKIPRPSSSNLMLI